MLRKNFLKEKLESGKVVLGTWSIIPSTIVIDIIASANLDFIIIDSEHAPTSFETAQNMVITCESRSVSPVMRVGGISETDILKALDIGVHCVQIPNVNTKADVEKIVNLSKYFPIGKRGFSPFTRAGDYSIKNSTKMTEISNANTLIAINVEGREAIDEIDNILSIEALDIVFIGLFDLSKALGIPGEIEDIRVTNYLKDLVFKINKAGKYAGTITTSEESISNFISMGMKYIVHLVDCEMLKKSYIDIKTYFDIEMNK